MKYAYFESDVLLKRDTTQCAKDSR